MTKIHLNVTLWVFATTYPALLLLFIHVLDFVIIPKYWEHCIIKNNQTRWTQIFLYCRNVFRNRYIFSSNHPTPKLHRLSHRVRCKTRHAYKIQQETNTLYTMSLTGMTQPLTDMHTREKGNSDITQLLVHLQTYRGSPEHKPPSSRMSVMQRHVLFLFLQQWWAVLCGLTPLLLPSLNESASWLFLLFWMYCTCSIKQSQGVGFSTNHNRNCIVIKDLKIFTDTKIITSEYRNGTIYRKLHHIPALNKT